MNTLKYNILKVVYKFFLKKTNPYQKYDYCFCLKKFKLFINDVKTVFNSNTIKV